MDTRVKLLMSAKEVFETKDPQEAAQMVQSQTWVAVNTYLKGGETCWCLIRIL